MSKIKIVTLSTGETTEKLGHSYISKDFNMVKSFCKTISPFLKKIIITITMKLPYDTAVVFLGT